MFGTIFGGLEPAFGGLRVPRQDGARCLETANLYKYMFYTGWLGLETFCVFREGRSFLEYRVFSTTFFTIFTKLRIATNFICHKRKTGLEVDSPTRKPREVL